MPILNDNFAQNDVNVQQTRAYLYKFEFNGETHRYSSYNVPITFLSEVYLPSNITHSSSDGKNGISLQASMADSFLLTIFTYLPVNDLRLIMYRVNGNLPSPTENDSYLLFDGYATNFSMKNLGVNVAFTQDIVDTSVGVPGIFCSKGCNWKLYNTNTCKVSRSAYEQTVTVDGIGLNRVIHITGTQTEENYYAFGDLLFGGVYHKIQFSSTDTENGGMLLQLNAMPLGLLEGDTVKIYAGCDKTCGMCNNKFNNLANFGGFPYVPDKNTSIDGV